MNINNINININNLCNKCNTYINNININNLYNKCNTNINNINSNNLYKSVTRTLIILIVIVYASTHLLIPSKELDAKSTTPLAGLVKTPTRPLPMPESSKG